MISAEQARNMKVELNDSDNKVLEDIEEKVVQAVSEYMDYCWYYATLPSRVVIELNKLGYNVHNQSDQREGILYKISW